jgi:hypothetical protein
VWKSSREELKLRGQLIHISREELYEKVWAFPLRKLAPEFGVSDVGLGIGTRKISVLIHRIG